MSEGGQVFWRTLRHSFFGSAKAFFYCGLGYVALLMFVAGGVYEFKKFTSAVHSMSSDRTGASYISFAKQLLEDQTQFMSLVLMLAAVSIAVVAIWWQHIHRYRAWAELARERLANLQESSLGDVPSFYLYLLRTPTVRSKLYALLKDSLGLSLPLLVGAIAVLHVSDVLGTTLLLLCLFVVEIKVFRSFWDKMYDLGSGTDAASDHHAPVGQADRAKETDSKPG